MKSQPNIILLVFDTMRKDAIGAYGGCPNTPFLDDFATDAVIFKNCVSPAPWTIPSHASFFTGKYPSEHGIHETRESKCLALKKAMNQVGIETLPEFMKQRASYNTLGFSANYFICPGSGFDRGFDSFNYSDARGIEGNEIEVIDQELRNHEEGQRQIAWELIRRGEFGKLTKLYLTYQRIKKRQESLEYPQSKGGREIVQGVKESSLREPFFLFANLMELHEPYVEYEMNNWSFSLEDLFGLRPIPLGVLKEIERRYYLAAGRLDSLFGQLMMELKARELYDDALIVVMSDHGQALKEKNYYAHGMFLHDEIVEVPLMIKFPNNKRFSVRNGYQSLVDIPNLIREVVEDNNITSDTITKEQAFSESFGIHYQFIPKGHGREVHEVQRKAVYKNGYKLVFNLTDEVIEEFSYRKKSLDPKLMNVEANSLVEELRTSHGKINNPELTTNPFGHEEELVILERLHALGYS